MPARQPRPGGVARSASTRPSSPTSRTGQHTLEVRALDGNELYDPSPARYTWTVGVPPNCDQANVTLTPTADGWVDEVNPTENYLFDQELEVRSEPRRPERGRGAGNGQNARTLVALPGADRRLRLRARVGHAADVRRRHTEAATLEARPLAAPFRESTLTWMSQPGA